jgi:Fic family protein
VESGVRRSQRRGGRYRAYVPDPLTGLPLAIDRDLAAALAGAERSIRRLTSGPGAGDLDGLSRFLMRSEAIASSMIEGIAPSPQQVALAELAQDERVRGLSDQARLVANNVMVLREAAQGLAAAQEVTVDDVVMLHAALLPDEMHRGLRRVQNWVGGSSWHPLDAQFVPPPHEMVTGLMSDLVDYLNGASHSPLVQAALVHAQFETIHPFTDGNGRVGRALIHTVLARRGLTSGAVLPVSMVLATLREAYVTGLTSFRFEGAATSSAGVVGMSSWLRVFVDAAEVAVGQAGRLIREVAELRSEWEARLAEHRSAAGVREAPRADSATARLLARLPEAPLTTARAAQRLLGVSFPSARSALEELSEAGIVHRKPVERNTTGYVAVEVFDLLTHAERRLASTQFDTRVAPPNRPVPAPPERRER